MNKEEIEQRMIDEEITHEYQGNLPSWKVNLISEILLGGGSSIYVVGKPINWASYIENLFELLEPLREKDIKKVYVPNIFKFNGQISTPEKFIKVCNLEEVEIYSGVEADGLKIPPGAAAFFRTADCPVIVYYDESRNILVAAHAGLASIIDKQLILTRKKSRKHFGIVDEIYSKVPSADNPIIHIVCGISSKSFIYDPLHPEYGEDNKEILRYLFHEYGRYALPKGYQTGNISIRGIITKKFMDYFNGKRFCIANDGLNTATNNRLWSHTRSVQYGEHEGRNGILVIHAR